VTGWQSGGGGSGDQGGWNQNQSFGPEAQTNRYGADPYMNQDPYQYGADPYGNQYGAGQYGAGQYGNDPYGAGGYDQYGQYQQQQYPPTGGFPAPGYGPPPPPPKRSKLPMILSLVAIVIIVGAVVTIVLVNRKDNQPVAQNDPSSTTSKEDPSTTGSKSSSEPTSTSGGGGEHDDWLSIDNTADSGLKYQVPPDWKESTSSVRSGLEVDFTGRADYGVYDCEGDPYVRTFAASGDVQGKDGADLDLATTMEDFAKSFAVQGYGEGAQVEVPAPTEVEVGGKPAMTLTAKVTVNATKPNCQASEAEVAMVGVQLESDGQPKGVAMLVVVNDLAGGPADPKPLDPAVTQEILSTVSAG
jgi:hypothetical protein